jgi:uncharacterized protein YdhG (YjbR/CyaY superfamily)
MVKSQAKTVAAYLKELPAERRKVLAEVRKLIRRRLPAGYEEAMNWGVIAYPVPFARFADTYNGQPLCYAGLAAQKNNYSLYLMCVYGHKEFQSRLREAAKQLGKKLDMGKACIRFNRVEDLPLEAIGDIIASVPIEQFISIYKQSRQTHSRPAKRARSRK